MISLIAATQLLTILSGLTAPTFLTHAGDGSHRLFIEEQAGVIHALARGASTPARFLDLRPKVLAGGERGLLGLAFHPLYEANGRFFVYYTRVPDGAIVISEYRVSDDPNVADPSDRVLLTIPHGQFANHNGGMLAFGPGGYLFIGVGDGGSGNDPFNNAQNVESLLGKMLRIDVDRGDTAAGTPYTIPAGNPYVDRPGRDEIFAIGFRNPWRFSFDRFNGRQWVADVGQNQQEEVNAPVLAGGNYGWRVYEGFDCTGIDRSSCTPSNYTRPLFDYDHSGDRCSITGGYVYRGLERALPRPVYTYADFCTGEIFTWDGRRQRVLLDTDLAIASFGEDEAGELYVVDLKGTIGKLVQ